MASGRTHALTGAAIGISACWLYSWLRGEDMTLARVALGACGGAFVGCLPDILEPADNPNHRSTFHSTFVAGLVGYASHTIISSSTHTHEEKLIAAVAGSAYLSHLALDSQTPKGLPLVA